MLDYPVLGSVPNPLSTSSSVFTRNVRGVHGSIRLPGSPSLGTPLKFTRSPYLRVHRRPRSPEGKGSRSRSPRIATYCAVHLPMPGISDRRARKLIRVTSDSAFLVAVHIQKGSPTMEKWFGAEVPPRTKNRFGRLLDLHRVSMCSPTARRSSTTAAAFTTIKLNPAFAGMIRQLG